MVPAALPQGIVRVVPMRPIPVFAPRPELQQQVEALDSPALQALDTAKAAPDAKSTEPAKRIPVYAPGPEIRSPEAEDDETLETVTTRQPTSDSTSAAHVETVSVTAAPEVIVIKPSDKQESDLLEGLAAGPDLSDEETAKVQLISLGCYCGPKLTFQKIGRGAETLPFDWLRTSLDGLMHMLTTRFDGFYDYVSKLPVPGFEPMTIYRSHLHSFWHDNPDESSMREKYERRIARMYGMAGKSEMDAGSSKKLLFVRVAASTQELSRSEELLQLLVGLFGSEVRLLLILNWQTMLQGPAMVADLPHLLVYFADGSIHDKSKQDIQGAPYAAAVKLGLDWSVDRSIEAASWSLSELQAQTDRNYWGYTGMGGLAAFEDISIPSPEETVPVPESADA